MTLRAALLVAVVVLSDAAAADDGAAAPAAPTRARRYLEHEFVAAYRARDEAEMTRLVDEMGSQPHLDPFRISNELCVAHARAVLAGASTTDDSLDAARSIARRAVGRRRNEALPRVVESWADADPSELRRRVDLRDALSAAEEAAGRRDLQSPTSDPARLTALASATPDVTSSLLLWRAACNLSDVGSAEARAAWRRGADYAARIPWPAGRAACLFQEGWQAFRSGDVADARALWLEEADLLASLGDDAEQGQTLLFVADAEEKLGAYADARALADRALVLAEGAGNTYVAAQAITQAASAMVLSGDVAGALPRLEEARRRFRVPPGSVVEAAWTLAVTARAYASLGLVDRAIAAFEQAIAEVETRPRYVADAARYRAELGQVCADAGLLDRAVELQQRALRDLESVGQRVDAAEARVGLGRTLALRGDRVRAAETIAAALADLERMGDRGAVARARAEFARQRAADGDARGACDAAARALAEMDAIGDRVAAAHVLRDLAAWNLALGRPADALAFASRAVETPLALGVGLGEAESAGLRRDARAAADAGIVAAWDVASADPSRAAELCAEAFRFAESSRGLSLAEGIVNREALFSGAASREDDAAARGRVAALRNRLSELAAKPAVEAAELTRARADLDAAYAALSESTARVQRDARRVADLVYPRPAALADVQAALPPDCALAVYHLAPERAFAVVATRASARLVDLGPAPAIDEAARAYPDLASVDGSDDARKAAALYDRLLRPLEAETVGRARLLVAPDGPLAFVPFEALVRTEGGRSERVIERWEVACVPSATVWRLLARDAAAAGPRGDTVVALGDPDYDDDAPAASGLRAYGRLRRLPGTAVEVRAIADIAGPDRARTLFGAQATSRGLAGALAGSGGRLAALHLACHGRIDPERPRLSGLVLSGGEVLSVDDVCALRVPADVVVLSACETGRGPVLRGEGVMGLARAFFFAGASRVVASNWAVSDDAASELMTAFATRLLRDGRRPGEALRTAKLEMLRGRPALAHPASWAAFVIWGD